MYDDFYRKAHELTQQGTSFVTATVVRAEKPTSGKPGDRAIITVDGVMYGWVGGSCAQPTVVQAALDVLTTGESKFIRLSPDPEQQKPRAGLEDLPMTCFSGGTLEIFLEPQRPRPRLLIVGSLPVARALAHLGQAMNYHVVAVDPDLDAATLPQADEVLHDLDLLPAQIRPDTYVVVATHGHYDEPALEKVLAAEPVYVGLVASPKRAQEVRQYLQLHGFEDEALLPLKAPAGLDIQARRGDEIALSIMAEIVQRRRNAEALDLALFQDQPATTVAVAADPAPAATPATAIDPICQMVVEIATAQFKTEYKGQMYYFCCAGCKTKFDVMPEQYLMTPGPAPGAISLGDIPIQ